MNRSRPLLTAALVLAFVAGVNIAFAMLVDRFGYDDVLREPPDVILTRVAAGGPSLVLIWLGFALGALAFVPVAIRLGRELGASSIPGVGVVTVLGIVSAVLQSAGLLRWVFVVPDLARTYIDPGASEAARAAALVAFQAVHLYGGVLIGEFLGQCFLIAWTIGTCCAMLHRGRTLRTLGALGLATVPAWLLGFTELLAPSIPTLRVIEAAPIAFMAWEAWLAALACALIFATVRPRAPGRARAEAIASPRLER